MTPTEAVALTGYIQAHFPSQPINDYTPDALGELLAEYPMGDCKAAVLAISRRGNGDRTQWCSPSDVAAEVKRIRAKRLNDHPEPIPPADMTPLETIAWLKGARKQIADGHTVSDDTRGQLHTRHLPDLRGVLSAPDTYHTTQETQT